MNVVGLILAVVAGGSFLAGAIQGLVAWHSADPYLQRRLRPSIIGCILLTIAFIGASYSYYSLSPAQNTPGTSTAPDQQAPPTGTIQAGTTATIVASTPSPTIIPCSKPCVVYQENGSDGWQGWALSTDWRVVDNNKLLSNDGSGGSSPGRGPSAIAPYSLPQGSQNFAIEVGITVPQTMNYLQHVLVTMCGSTTSDGWQGYAGLIGHEEYAPNSEAGIFADHERLAKTDFDPNGALHTYRIEVKGNVISLFVDQARVVQGTDNKFLPCGGQIGIASALTVVHISSFKVTLL